MDHGQNFQDNRMHGRRMNELTLIPPSVDYAEAFLSWRREPIAKKYNPLLQLDLNEVKERLSKCHYDLSNLKENEQYRWFIRLKGELVGQVAMSGVNLMMGTAEIGYTVAENFHGKGIGTTAVKSLVKKIFNETSLRKIIAIVHEENIASCKLLEKIGFKREGLLREHFIVNGDPANEAYYGLLRRECVDVNS